jgi:hypothetical protein
MAGEDESVITAAMTRLEEASHKLAAAMYQASAQQPSAAPGPDAGPEPPPHDASQENGGNRDGVIDAEYVVDDKKN